MSSSSEIMAKRSSDYLLAVQHGKSFFGEIPSDIGEIVYCDTNNSFEAPKSPEVIKKKRIGSTAVSIALLVLIWVFLHNSIVWAIILSIAVIVVAILIIVNASSFDGTDYFVGTEGFAEIKFEKTRDNIVNRRKYYFRDFSEFVTGETYRKVNYVYQGTDYFGSFMGKPNEKNEVDMLVEYSGTYHQEKPKDEIIEQDYLFIKEVEKAWTQYKLEEIKSKIATDGFYTFNVVTTIENSLKFMVYPYIKFTQDSIEIGGHVYNNETLKSMYFSNGCLIIEHINHSRKLLGLIEKGQKDEIPLTNVGNKKIFLMFLEMMTSPC